MRSRAEDRMILPGRRWFFINPNGFENRRVNLMDYYKIIPFLGRYTYNELLCKFNRDSSLP
jgi:hypothetical protein